MSVPAPGGARGAQRDRTPDFAGVRTPAFAGPPASMPVVAGATRARQQQSHRRFLRSIAPELLSGASDNDPTNVGTAVAVGTQTAYQLSWVALLVAPLLAVVLAIAAEVGAVAHGDLQSLVVNRYGRRVGVILVLTVVIVNVVTIAADLQAGAAGIGLLGGVDPRFLVVPLGLALVGLLIVGKYDEVVVVLRYALLGFLAFGAAAVLAGPDWSRLLRASFIPSVSLRRDAVVGGLALLGTTLTSYVYVWETVARGSEQSPDDTASDEGRARAKIGAVVGAVFTAVILWFMLVASAATLGRHHETVGSAQDAARALGPLAGTGATDLFAVGLITSAVVALPVLMATTAYVVGAQFDWRRGLSERLGNARAFYGALAASLALGFAATLAKVSVIGVLVAASVVGGLGTPFGLILLVLLARDSTVMGSRPISGLLAIAGWTVTLIVGGFGLLFLVAAALGKL